jgi:two-component system cell cycle response regulator DivK
MTVLAIEDEPDILLMIRTTLEYNGFNVITALTGEDGLDLLRRERPDVVLLDIRLPGIDGWEVLHQIKRDDAVSSTPVVMVSAHATPTTPRRALEAGCSAYLTKPFRPNDLCRVVGEAAGA